MCELSLCLNSTQTEKESFQKLGNKFHTWKVHELPAIKQFMTDFHLKVWIEAVSIYSLILAFFWALAKMKFP